LITVIVYLPVERPERRNSMARGSKLLVPAFGTLAAFAALPAPALAAGTKPAGGAALGQVFGATAGMMVATAILLYFTIGYRTGRVALLERASVFAERVSGLPRWSAIPSVVAATSLVTALFGMLWDISIHIAKGRDPGPLANPAHYFILVGLFGIFTAGFIGMVLPKEKPTATALRITGDWYAPLGAVLVTACGAFALLGFPLDDVWHRLFGQDVTLWGPTHLMLIGGAAMTLLGMAVLQVEASRATADRPASGVRLKPYVRWVERVALTGGLMAGLSVFQGEWDFGVPQFRFIFAPMLVMFAAGAGLVAARVWLGRGAAVGAALFFLAIRGLMALLVGGIIGNPTPHFPLYLAEALLVEAVAFAVPPRRTLAFGLTAGVVVGTAGLAAEWAWSHIYPIAWPSTLFPEGAIFGLAMALCGALLGAYMGERLASDELRRTPALRVAGLIAAAATAGMIGYGLHKTGDPGVRASVTTTTVHAGPKRTVDMTVKLDPPNAAKDAILFNVTAWQGGGLYVDSLKKVAPGTYRTTEPIPVYGDWKSLIRLQRGDKLAAVPVYLPDDPAIPVKGVPAQAHFTRAFVPDHVVLQRESKVHVKWLWNAAIAVVAAITLLLLVAFAWSLHRLAVAVDGRDRQRRAAATEPPPAPRVGTGVRVA
jgi:hypothetical protein